MTRADHRFGFCRGTALTSRPGALFREPLVLSHTQNGLRRRRIAPAHLSALRTAWTFRQIGHLERLSYWPNRGLTMLLYIEPKVYVTPNETWYSYPLCSSLSSSRISSGVAPRRGSEIWSRIRDAFTSAVTENPRATRHETSPSASSRDNSGSWRYCDHSMLACRLPQRSVCSKAAEISC